MTLPPGSALLPVRVKPRARRSVVEGVRDGVWQVEVTASPVDNAANEAVVQVLARALGRPKSTICVARGHKSRDKLLRCDGLSPEEALERLNARSD